MSVASCTCTRHTARRSATPPGPTGGPARARTRAGGRARVQAAAGGRGWWRGRGVWAEQGGGQGELGRATRAGRLGAGRRRTRLKTYCSSSLRTSSTGCATAAGAATCTSCWCGGAPDRSREWAGHVCWPWSATWPRHGGGERWISGTAGGRTWSPPERSKVGFLIPLSITELKKCNSRASSVWGHSGS